MRWRRKKTGQWPVLPKMVLTVSHNGVLTLLKCDVIFNDDSVTNLPLSVMVENFKSQSASGEIVGKSKVHCGTVLTYHG